MTESPLCLKSCTMLSTMNNLSLSEKQDGRSLARQTPTVSLNLHNKNISHFKSELRRPPLFGLIQTFRGWIKWTFPLLCLYGIRTCLIRLFFCLAALSYAKFNCRKVLASATCQYWSLSRTVSRPVLTWVHYRGYPASFACCGKLPWGRSLSCFSWSPDTDKTRSWLGLCRSYHRVEHSH